MIFRMSSIKEISLNWICKWIEELTSRRGSYNGTHILACPDWLRRMHKSRYKHSYCVLYVTRCQYVVQNLGLTEEENKCRIYNSHYQTLCRWPCIVSTINPYRFSFFVNSPFHWNTIPYDILQIKKSSFFHSALCCFLF